MESEVQRLEDDPAAHKSVYASLLQSCKSVSIGARIHRLIDQRCLAGDVFLANHLVNMYSRCYNIQDAIHVFDAIPCKNVFSWNIMLNGLVTNSKPREALRLFRRMDLAGVKQTMVSFVGAVRACSGIGDLKQGRTIHSRVLGSVRQLSLVLSTCLITMYGKCSALDDARRVFDGMEERNEVSWNAMISAYAQQGYGSEALELFWKMEFDPSEVTLVSALDACASAGDLNQGKRLHSLAAARLASLSHFVDTALVNMYAKCSSLGDARRVFDRMEKEDVVAWTAMIAACVQHGEAMESLELFWKMEQEGVKPDKVVFVNLVDACSCLSDLNQSRRIHNRLRLSGFDSDSSIASGLVNMYRKSGNLAEARSIFGRMNRSDLLSWNALIAGYVEQGDRREALQVFRWMICEGTKPDGVTFNSILGAFSSARFLQSGKAVHAQSVACGIDVQAVGISLVKMYGQCGSLDDAKAVFDELESKDVVAWSALIGAHTQHGHGLQALQLYRDGMQQQGVKANDITFISLLDACASTGELSAGIGIHAEITAAGFEGVAFVATALVNMYGKCGELSTARGIFDRIHPRDVVSWTAMISAYVLHSYHREALELYFRLEPEGMKPDRVTYLSVLEACSSQAALKQGRAVHASIISSGLLESDTGLNNAIINFYGKCGSLTDAESVFERMRCRDLVTWNSMITTYSHHGRDETALETFMQMKLDGVQPDDVTFVSVLFVCSHAGLFEDGCRCFGSIGSDYFTEAKAEHYNCVVDLLSRAGNLDEAETMVAAKLRRGGDGDDDADAGVDWMSLLAACRIQGDADRALRTAQRVVALDPDSLAGKVLLSNVFATARDWDEEPQLCVS